MCSPCYVSQHLQYIIFRWWMSRGLVVFRIELVLFHEQVPYSLEQPHYCRDASFREEKVQHAPSWLTQVELVRTKPTEEERQYYGNPSFASCHMVVINIPNVTNIWSRCNNWSCIKLILNSFAFRSSMSACSKVLSMIAGKK